MDFFLAKMGAIMHDPPHKAWLLKSRKSHVAEAEAICKKALGGLFDKVQEVRDVIDASDELSASIDRWLLSEIVRGEYGKFSNLTICITNLPFSSNYFRPPDPLREECVQDFADNIASHIGEVSDVKLKYHLLYSVYEPLFYEHCPKCVSPADTRIPIHTIFDHLYASATMVNWVYRKDRRYNVPRGLLIRIDLAGVQRFISSSRKLSDFWVSSWLTSFIVWKIIEVLVENVGPDILVKPTSRHNAFYYHFLLTKLKGTVSPDTWNVLLDIAKKYAGYDEEFGMPRHSIIPSMIDIVLPPYEVLSELLSGLKVEVDSNFKLARFLTDNYTQAWENIFNNVEKAIQELQDGWLKDKLIEAMNESREIGLNKQPPLPLRIIVVSIPDEVAHEGLKDYNIYHAAFKRLSEKALSLKQYNVSAQVATNLTEFTEKKGEGYKTCSVCGTLPAVLELPYKLEDYRGKVPEPFRVYFDQGESLCGYCLIKRLMSVPDVFKKLAKDVFLCIGDPHPASFPSTGDIASIEFKEKIVEVARKLDERGRKDLLEAIKTYLPTLPKLLPVSMYRKLTSIRDPIKDVKEEELRRFLELLLILQSEQLFLRYEGDPQAYERQREFLRKLREITKSVGESLQIRIYYSILRADADSMGKLFAGRLIEALFPVPKADIEVVEKYVEVLEKVLTNKDVILNENLRKLYSYVIKVAKGSLISHDEYNEAIKAIESERIPDAQKRLQAFTDLFKESIKEFIVTPTYHAAISRALMISAIKDVGLVEKAGGVVIYAGGDDLLSILPVKNILDVVIETRRHYSEGDPSELGFYELGNGIFPTLGLASRSYAVVFGHYLFPMSSLLEESRKALEKAKGIMITKPQQMGKDGITFMFIPRGGGVKAEGILSLRPYDGLQRAFLIDCVKYVIKEVDSNKFSESLYYDLSKLLSEEELTHYIQRHEVLEALLKRTITRNVSQRLHVEEKTHEINKMVERFRDCLHWEFDVGGRVHHALEGMILTLLAYHSAVGERE